VQQPSDINLAEFPKQLLLVLKTLPFDDVGSLVAFWLPLFLSLVLIVPGIVSRLIRSWRYRFHPVEPSMDQTPREATLAFLSASMVINFIAGVFPFINIATTRYLMSDLQAPLIVFGIFVLPLLTYRIRNILVVLALATVATLYGRTTVNIGHWSPALFRWNSELKKELEVCIEREGLKAGLANYWLSRRTMAALNWSIQINQLEPDYPRIFHWGSNSAWFTRTFAHEADASPNYNFVVRNGFQDADVIKEFGPWEKVVSCGELSIAKYEAANRILQTIREQQFLARPVVLNRQEKLSLPLRSFSSQISQLRAGIWQTDSERPRSGFLIFGPYLTLPVGRYKVSLVMSAAGLLGENKIDVVTNLGSTVLANRDLGNTSIADERALDLEFVLDQEAKNVEIRVFYGGSGTMQVREIRIERQ
jgi:hypothetical protein